MRCYILDVRFVRRFVAEAGGMSLNVLCKFSTIYLLGWHQRKIWRSARRGAEEGGSTIYCGRTARMCYLLRSCGIELCPVRPGGALADLIFPAHIGITESRKSPFQSRTCHHCPITSFDSAIPFPSNRGKMQHGACVFQLCPSSRELVTPA